MANDLNSIIVAGRLTADPLKKETVNGKPYVVFTTASNRFFKRTPDSEWEQKPSFLSVFIFNGMSENFNAKKGDKVRIVGRMESEPSFHIEAEHYEIVERFQA